MEPKPPFNSACLRLLSLLRQGQVDRARSFVDQQLRDTCAEMLYLKLLIPTVFYAGELFTQGQILLTELNSIVANSMMLVEDLRPRLNRQPRLHKKLYATYMAGDHHSIGLVAIAHWLDRDGWDVVFPLPAPSERETIQKIIAEKPEVIAISCSLPKHVVHARRVIRAVKEGGVTAPVWVGGVPINISPSFFERTGADHTAVNIVSFTRDLASRYGYITGTPAEMM